MDKGRPTIYKPEYCQAIIDYFNIKPYKKIKLQKTFKDGGTEDKYEEVANDLPTFEGFAISIGVHRETLIEWCKVHSDFSDAYRKAKDCQKYILNINGLRGNYNPLYSKFVAINATDMVDKKDITTTDKNKLIEQTKDMTKEEIKKRLNEIDEVLNE